MSSNQIMTRFSHLAIAILALFGGWVPTHLSAQRLDAPQARVLYEADEYSIQAMVLYQSALILFCDASGPIKPMLEVPRVIEPLDEESVRADSSRIQRQQNLNQGLEVAGTDQRIIGIATNDEFMFVLVAGIADIDPDSLATAVDEASGDSVATEQEEETQVVRIMLHAYRHEIARREFSFEVILSPDVELEPARFGEGPLELTEWGVACYGWEFDFEEPDYVEATSPDGESLSLPTVLTTDRMRSI